MVKYLLVAVVAVAGIIGVAVTDCSSVEVDTGVESFMPFRGGGNNHDEPRPFSLEE